MGLKARIKQKLPRVAREIMPGYLEKRRNHYYKRISLLPIDSSGLSHDGIPWVRLDNGLVFYGYLPTRTQQYIYRYFIDRHIRDKLDEVAFAVACDIVMRYLGPQSRYDDIGQGKYYDLAIGDTVIEIGAYIGYYAMRAAELVGESGRVVAIEAIEDNAEILKKM